MSDKYREYEKTCEKIRDDNKRRLSAFGEWLTQNGLTEKTVRQHTQNIDLYINEYLLYEEPIAAAKGAHHIGMFLGYWFIKKALWSSGSAIKSNATSLKKFYTFMQEQGMVSEEDLRDMKEAIKEGMPEWLARMRRYEDPSISDPAEIWGL